MPVLIVRAQRTDYIKDPAIGIYYSIFNFKSADYIRKYSLSEAFKNGQVFNSANMVSGLALSYINGLKPHFDLAVSMAGTYTNYTLYNGEQLGTGKLLLEGDISVIGKILTDKHLVSPYLIAGIGISEYNSYYGMLIPLGFGGQVNFSNIAYLLVNAEYRMGITSKTDNHFYYSVGIAGNIKRRKKKPKAIPAALPVKELNNDRDGDGVLDSLDLCPDVPGLKQFQGCPDSDGDGIPDGQDKCPQVAGTIKYQGCPVPDIDNDGVPDEEDSCKSVKGLARYHGCPIPDSDGDGINDEEDACPLVAGTQANRGCPEISDTLKKRLEYDAKNIYFPTNRYDLKPQSFKALDDVIRILNQQPAVYLVIEGHTDNVGTAQKNIVLSENRANAVKNYLIEKGRINKNRLMAAGYGMTRPVADNGSAKGRALNRRVELKLKYSFN